ncbi:hypothetical protein [Alicyclobacillus sp. ALC3]|uniref:hypothetical protein n=1 Tax=Alicyclobacillus sp. ALC3 TaxID=2796143 RepID=UPI002378B3D0|nr:hypothetical protein [Alicyclobacillus sp. ALC3]WDL99771.1 hypothetical protein JC200_23650 [Alicyclobacillus sp. ALC3]
MEEPLRVMEELDGLRPDFVLRGHKLPVIVEVYGRTGDPAYDEHKEIKRTIYRTYEREGLIHYVEWDVSERRGKESFLAQLNALPK